MNNVYRIFSDSPRLFDGLVFTHYCSDLTALARYLKLADTVERKTVRVLFGLVHIVEKEHTCI